MTHHASSVTSIIKFTALSFLLTSPVLATEPTDEFVNSQPHKNSRHSGVSDTGLEPGTAAKKQSFFGWGKSSKNDVTPSPSVLDRLKEANESAKEKRNEMFSHTFPKTAERLQQQMEASKARKAKRTEYLLKTFPKTTAYMQRWNLFKNDTGRVTAAITDENLIHNLEGTMTSVNDIFVEKRASWKERLMSGELEDDADHIWDTVDGLFESLELLKPHIEGMLGADSRSTKMIEKLLEVVEKVGPVLKKGEKASDFVIHTLQKRVEKAALKKLHKGEMAQDIKEGSVVLDESGKPTFLRHLKDATTQHMHKAWTKTTTATKAKKEAFFATLEKDKQLVIKNGKILAMDPVGAVGSFGKAWKARIEGNILDGTTKKRIDKQFDAMEDACEAIIKMHPMISTALLLNPVAKAGVDVFVTLVSIFDALLPVGEDAMEFLVYRLQKKIKKRNDALVQQVLAQKLAKTPNPTFVPHQSATQVIQVGNDAVVRIEADTLDSVADVLANTTPAELASRNDSLAQSVTIDALQISKNPDVSATIGDEDAQEIAGEDASTDTHMDVSEASEELVSATHDVQHDVQSHPNQTAGNAQETQGEQESDVTPPAEHTIQDTKITDAHATSDDAAVSDAEENASPSSKEEELATASSIDDKEAFAV